MMRTFHFFPLQWQDSQRRRIFCLLAGLALMLVSLLNVASPAYADPLTGCAVVGWGSNFYGALNAPADLTDILEIEAGYAHSLALKTDGTVVGWGDNGYGQATVPAGLVNVVAISAGNSHNLALKVDGTIVAWGGNSKGQLNIPAGLSNVKAISAGYNHSLALKTDGTVVGWGDNGAGQATVPAGLVDVKAISAGFNHSLALKTDGTIVGWGDNSYGQATPPVGLSGVVAIAAATQHSLALKTDGTVVAWGSNSNGQLNIPAGLANVVAIAVGSNHNLALKTDGAVVAWGSNTAGKSTPPAGLANVIAISAGGEHSLALISACAPPNTPPTVAADNANVAVTVGQTATNTGTVSDADGDTVTLSASVGTVVNNNDGAWSWTFAPNSVGSQTVTITADDGNGGANQTSFTLDATPVVGCAVVAWGINESGIATPPAGLSNVIAVSAGGFHSLALQADGTVVGWGDDSYGQATPPIGLTNVVAISAGAEHSLALKADGTVVGWGENSDGRATPPAGLTDVVAISAGTGHSLALKADGTVVGWGGTYYGDLVAPAGLSDVVAIRASYVHSLALKSDGTVVVWGGGDTDLTMVPPGLGPVVAIGAGAFHNLVLKADGTVFGWGDDSAGQATPPAGLSNVVAISGGGAFPPLAHSLALKADGTVVGWGNDDFGQATPPIGLTNVVAIDAGFFHSLAITTLCPPANTAPAVTDDSYATNEDTPLTVPAPGVLGNDSDAEGDPLTAQPVTSTAHGALLLNPDGSFTYTPDTNFTGSDSFTYLANDGMMDSNAATVTLVVNAVNDAPTALDDSYSTDEDTPLSVPAPGVLANDSDIEGDTISAVLVNGPAHGSLTLNPDGSFAYTPNADFNGSDSFTYKANDGAADSNVATIAIVVNAVNDVPVAVADSYVTNEDTLLSIAAPGLLANDSDLDGNPLTAALVDAPSNGVLVLNSDGSLSYTPNANFNGSDSFTYQVNDGLADSNVATVLLTVSPVNDAPTAVNDSYLTDEDVPLNVPAPGVQDNDNDVDGDVLLSIVVTNPANGALTLNPDGSFAYTPNQDFNGSDNFSYKLNDGAVDSNVATVTITIGGINDAPVAADDSYSTDEDTPLNVPAPGVLGNDGDVDNDPLTMALVDAPLHGSLTLNPDGSFSYTPAIDFSGSDSFTYQLSDGQVASNVATAHIMVNAVNDAPLAENDSYSTNEDVALNVSAPGVLGNDTDPDGDALSAVLVSAPANGGLTLNSDGSFSYTPNANFNGSDSFSYKVSDGAVDSNIASVSITIVAVNDPPVAGNDSYSTHEDTPLNVPAPGVLSNDSDPVEGSLVTAVLVSGPSHGSLALNPDGSFSYTPAPNYSGADGFTYKANDGGADSNIATVSIEVISASSLIDDLIAKVQALVDNGVLNGGQGNGLIVKLNNAKKKLMGGQTNTAINMMQAFINQVNAFSGNQLTPAQAQDLIDDANAIIVALN